MATAKLPRRRSAPHGTQAWLAVVRAYNLCEVVMTARLAAIGLRVGEHEVLATIATAPGITQQELAARCFVTKSGISMLLAQMEEKRWVRRESDGADARVKRLVLAASGQAIAAKALAVQAEVIAAMVAASSEADLESTRRLMEEASTRLEAMRDA